LGGELSPRGREGIRNNKSDGADEKNVQEPAANWNKVGALTTALWMRVQNVQWDPHSGGCVEEGAGNRLMVWHLAGRAMAMLT
jgi:hypothetical protein